MFNDKLLQKMNCPYGKGEVIIVINDGENFSGKCMLAAEALRKHSWSRRRMEKELRKMGCPKPSGATRRFRKPECPFNQG